MHNVAKNKHHVAEEVANAVTHGLGALAAVVALVLMLIKATPVLSGVNFAAVAIYGGSLVLLFLCSTLYHSFTHLPSGAWLQRLDHSAIFLLIAGTYTPFLMIALHTPQARLLLMVLWGIAFAGVMIKLFFLHRFERFSLLVYLVMGWLALFVVRDLYRALPTDAFQLLWIGGLVYTVGAAFYAADQYRYSHPIWHLFVLGGAACHCVAIGVYVIPTA